MTLVGTLLLSAAVSVAAAPCDIFAAAGTPCVAAHSTTRSLFSAFSASLYQVSRASDGELKDIPVVAPGGVANSAIQDTFCSSTTCTISRIYDQTSLGNDLTIAPQHVGHNGSDMGTNASKDPLKVGGVQVYSVFFEGGMGYRNDNTTGIPVGDEAQTIYAVFSGLHYNNKCCHDYGNAERTPRDDGAGTMEALYFGSAKGGMNHGGAGPGPWLMGDLEQGLFGSNKTDSSESSITHTFVTGMFKGDTGPAPGHMAIKGGDAQQGPLTVFYDGWRPKGYAPMKKQGSIIMGIGGDNSDKSVGTFYEGAMIKGFTTDAADDAVQKDIVAAGYELA